jgi:hypothetical protein
MTGARLLIQMVLLQRQHREQSEPNCCYDVNKVHVIASLTDNKGHKFGYN